MNTREIKIKTLNSKTFFLSIRKQNWNIKIKNFDKNFVKNRIFHKTEEPIDKNGVSTDKTFLSKQYQIIEKLVSIFIIHSKSNMHVT